jgi:flavin-binding protein dodecin
VTVYNTIELTGVSAESWSDAAHTALADASRTIRNITRMEILDTRAEVDGNTITEFHTTVRVYFRVEN